MAGEKSVHQSLAEAMILVPEAFLKTLLENQNKILQLLMGGNNQQQHLGDYVDQREAMKLMGKKNTWFWKMRVMGKLSYSKVGNKVFYQRKELEKLIEDNNIKAYRK